MNWDPVLGLTIASIVVVNLVVLKSMEPMMERLNTWYLNTRDRVEIKHAEQGQFYYIHKVIKMGEFGLLIIIFLTIFDALVALSTYSILGSPPGWEGVYYPTIAILLGLMLLTPPFCIYLKKREKPSIIAVSGDCIEVWNVLRHEAQCGNKIKWPQIDRVEIVPHDNFVGDTTVDTFVLIESFLFRRPKDYDIVLNAGSMQIIVGIQWPNAMRLLEDALRLAPKAKGWKDFNRMRKEVEKWKSETTSAS